MKQNDVQMLLPLSATPRHSSYSEVDYARLIAVVHDGLSGHIEPRERPAGQGRKDDAPRVAQLPRLVPAVHSRGLRRPGVRLYHPKTLAIPALAVPRPACWLSTEREGQRCALTIHYLKI